MLRLSFFYYAINSDTSDNEGGLKPIEMHEIFPWHLVIS